MMWKQRLREFFGLKVNYDASFFGDTWFENWEALKFVLKELIEFDSHWQRIFDFGCGPGVMIDLMNNEGYDYVGFDTSDQARELYLNRFGGYPKKFTNNLEHLKDSEWDLCISFDVLEHMEDEQVIDVFSGLSNVSELFLNISRQKGIPGHINLKEDNDWVRLFKEIGFKYNSKKSESLRMKYLELRPNAQDQWHENIFLFCQEND